jgi:hypothetical protein
LVTHQKPFSPFPTVFKSTPFHKIFYSHKAVVTTRPASHIKPSSSSIILQAAAREIFLFPPSPLRVRSFRNFQRFASLLLWKAPHISFSRLLRPKFFPPPAAIDFPSVWVFVCACVVFGGAL